MSDPLRAAYAAALAMLSRRELSEAQLRERLALREHQPEAVSAALERLRAAGAVDDRRVALSAARTEASVKGRGRARVLLKLRSIGIPPDIADAAADEVLGGLDEALLIQRAIDRRLRPAGATIRDAAHFRRLLQQLVRQGFSPAAAARELKALARRAVVEEESE